MLNRDNTSKLLQLFFLTELAKRVPSSLSVISAATPGFVYGTKSDIDSDGTFKGYVAQIVRRIFGYYPDFGARQLTYAAVKHRHGTHGQYFCSQKLKP